MDKSVFEILFEINVNDHVEKKNGLSHLSWPYAWTEVKKRFPEANYKVYITDAIVLNPAPTTLEKAA